VVFLYSSHSLEGWYSFYPHHIIGATFTLYHHYSSGLLIALTLHIVLSRLDSQLTPGWVVDSHRLVSYPHYATWHVSYFWLQQLTASLVWQVFRPVCVQQFWHANEHCVWQVPTLLLHIPPGQYVKIHSCLHGVASLKHLFWQLLCNPCTDWHDIGFPPPPPAGDATASSALVANAYVIA